MVPAVVVVEQLLLLLPVMLVEQVGKEVGLLLLL
jgi:hypothetical protein